MKATITLEDTEAGGVQIKIDFDSPPPAILTESPAVSLAANCVDYLRALVNAVVKEQDMKDEEETNMRIVMEGPS